MTGPELVALGGGWALLRGLALADASRAVSYVVKQGRRDGVRAPRLTRLEAALRGEVAAAMAANGHTNATDTAVVVPFPQDVMSTEEVAAATGISPRHVRRQADELGGRKIAGRWCFDPVIVHAAAAENTQRDETR
jgi:hypothetical protein